MTMKELHIPALDFMNVKGNIHYDDGEMTFTGVNARVYGGTVSASGNYNIDSRSYDIYLHGEDLDSRIPSNEPKFYCLVDLDGEIHCDGDQKHLVAFGRFSSTPRLLYAHSFQRHFRHLQQPLAGRGLLRRSH